jgi:hypothetical protein
VDGDVRSQTAQRRAAKQDVMELAGNYLKGITKKSKTDDTDARALVKSKAKTQQIAQAKGLLDLIAQMELGNSDGTHDDLINGLKANHIKVVQGICAD